MASRPGPLTSSSTSNPTSVVISGIEDIKSRLIRVEQKQVLLQTALEELKDLMKPNMESSFQIKGSNFQVHDSKIHSL